MQFCIAASDLRAALAEIEAAEKNGFRYCLAVFGITEAGPQLSDCRATYSDMIERAHPSSPTLNWGRFQSVSKRNRFDGEKLVPIDNT